MKRNEYLDSISHYFKTHPVVATLGPRQCGKTTLARHYRDLQEQEVHYFDLGDVSHLALLENPKFALQGLEGLIIIDEIQKRPDLFPTLRVLADQENTNQRFLILGSASRELIQQSSETLAGRIAYMQLTPFSYREVGHMDDLWYRGGFPKSYLAASIEESIDWREFYISTFLEQDIPNLGFNIPPMMLRRTWTMLSHYHGNVVNYSELGNSLGISDNTVRRYLDILTNTFMIRQLLPWHENIKKRQVKSPKIYFRDSGIYHILSGLSRPDSLRASPKIGASWEGFALEEMIRSHRIQSHDCYFWKLHSGPELDLLVLKDGARLGFEFKYSDAPKTTRSMHIAVETLELDQLTIISPAGRSFQLSEKIGVCGLAHYIDAL